MPKRDVEAEILDALEKFLQTGEKLPALEEGKVNVTGLCKRLGLRASDVQHFYRKSFGIS